MMLAGLFERRADVLGSSHPGSAPSWISPADTFAGIHVTPDNALGVAAVFAAVRVCVESTAVLSIDLFKRLSGGGKDVERDHQSSWIVREDANPETSAFIFRETLQGFVETWGNAHAEIDFGRTGRPMALYQRRPDRVELTRTKSGDLEYLVTPVDGGTARPVPAKNMLHIAGFGGSGLQGLSPVEVLRETVGRNKALGQYRSASFGNRMQLNGFLTHPLGLDAPVKEAMIAELEAVHKGSGRAFRTAVLDEGMGWQQVGFPNDAAQMIETGVYELQDVARAWRIPLHLLQELTHATFTNIEHQDLNFAKHTLMPRCQRWVSELNRKLLTEAERRAGLFFEINLDTLLRGDFETRQNGFSAAVGSGRMTPNEARSLDNMNPVDGGDTTYVPLNWRDVSAPMPEPKSVTEKVLPDGTRETRTEFIIAAAGQKRCIETEVAANRTPASRLDRYEGRETVRDLSTAAQRSAESRWRLRDTFEKLLAVAAGRIVTAEVNAIRKEIQKIPLNGEAAFRLWMESFFQRHAEFVTEVAGPVLYAMAESFSAEALQEVDGDAKDFAADLEAFSTEYARAFGTKTAAISRGQLERAMRGVDNQDALVDALDAVLRKWEESKAGSMALSTSTDIMGAASVAAYTFAGVRVLRWVWNGGECKICPNMHGKVVAIGQPFVQKGDKIGDPERTTPLEMKQVRRYPGLHGGCVCTVAPG